MYRFEKLQVYTKTKVFVNSIFDVAEMLPSSMRYSLVSQITRAAISIMSNIAEGSGRKDAKDERNFYNIAKASVYEVVSQLDIALMRGYIDDKLYKELYAQSEEICKMLTGLMKHNDKK